MDFGEKMLSRKLLAAPDLGSGAPGADLSEESSDELPDKPLLMSEIEKMNDASCLYHIEKRHHLSKDRLFSISEGIHLRLWSLDYLTKLALMRLEAVPTHKIANFFAHEFGLLNQRDITVNRATITTVCRKYFSDELKKAILTATGRQDWLVAGALENKDLISELEARTSLHRRELFSERARYEKDKPGYLGSQSKFSTDDVLKAFLLRLERKPSKEILPSLDIRIHGRNDVSDLYSQFRKTFSKKAMELLPDK